MGRVRGWSIFLISLMMISANLNSLAQDTSCSDPQTNIFCYDDLFDIGDRFYWTITQANQNGNPLTVGDGTTTQIEDLYLKAQIQTNMAYKTLPELITSNFYTKEVLELPDSHKNKNTWGSMMQFIDDHLLGDDRLIIPTLYQYQNDENPSYYFNDLGSGNFDIFNRVVFGVSATNNIDVNSEGENLIVNVYGYESNIEYEVVKSYDYSTGVLQYLYADWGYLNNYGNDFSEFLLLELTDDPGIETTEEADTTFEPVTIEDPASSNPPQFSTSSLLPITISTITMVLLLLPLSSSRNKI